MLPSWKGAAVQRWQGLVQILSGEDVTLGYAHAELWSSAERRSVDGASVYQHHWEGTVRSLSATIHPSWPGRKPDAVRLRLIGSEREGMARLDGEVVADSGGHAVLLWAKVVGIGAPPF